MKDLAFVVKSPYLWEGLCFLWALRICFSLLEFILLNNNFNKNFKENDKTKHPLSNNLTGNEGFYLKRVTMAINSYCESKMFQVPLVFITCLQLIF